MGYIVNTYCTIFVVNSEHQELLKQIQETQDSKVREDLEQKLSCLVKQMNIKEEQISKLKKHQTSVRKKVNCPACNTLVKMATTILPPVDINWNVTGMLKLGCSNMGD